MFMYCEHEKKQLNISYASARFLLMRAMLITETGMENENKIPLLLNFTDTINLTGSETS